MAYPPKPSLTCIVGSGFSVGLGLPGTDALTDVVKRAGWQPFRHPLAEQSSPPSPSEIVEHLARGYYRNPNFETLIHVAETALAYQGVEEWLSRNDISKPAYGAFMDLSPRWRPVLEGPEGRSSLEAFISSAYAAIRRLLVNEARSVQHSASSRIRSLFDSVGDQYRIIVGTLNYDDLIERGIDEWHDGFIQWGEGYSRFDPALFYSSERAGIELLHLHGSVRFFLSSDGTICRTDGDNESGPRSSDTIKVNSSQSGDPLVFGPMISGLRKTDKLLGSPFMHYNLRLQESIFRNPRVLVIGYGGMDAHLNFLIDELLRIHRADLRIAFIVNHRRGNSDFYDKGLIMPLGFLSVPQMSTANLAQYYDELLSADGWIRTKCARVLLTGFPLHSSAIAELTDFFRS